MKCDASLLIFTLLTAWSHLSVTALADEAVLPPTKPTAITRDSQSVHPGILAYTAICAYQKQPNKIEILLPDDYAKDKHYPVVYMLPVNVGTDGPWGSGVVEAKKANLQNQYQMIFVAPAYDTVPWFGDNPLHPETRQNSYITDVVVPFIDKEFSTVGEAKGRLLISFSKAGLGAWSLFLKHLDLFDQVAIFDSFEGPPTNEQWVKWGFIDTYGTRENYDNYDPFILLEKQKEILRQCPRRITILGGGPGSRVGVDQYHTKLQDYKIPYIYIQGSYMEHNWYSGWLPLAVAGMAYPGSMQPQAK